MRPSCLMLLIASGILFASSFTTWIQFRPQLPPGMDMPTLDPEMLAMLTATGWQGCATLGGVTVPNWFVPVLSVALAGFALMRAADIFEAPRALVITFASYCMAHVGLLVVVVALAGPGARLGLGVMLAMVASIVAFAASLMRAEQHEPEFSSEPMQASAGGAGYGRVIGTRKLQGTVDDVPSSPEFSSRPHQRT